MQNIVIIGTGFAGLWSALSAKRLINLHNAQDSITVTVISPEPHLVMRPRLYEANAKDMKTPLTPLLEQSAINFEQGTVSAINASDKTVTLQNGDNVPYDRLVLAAGSRLKQPRIPGLAEHSFSIDTLADASAFERHLKNLASLPSTAARNTAVVVGGGFTGIEVAAELPSRLCSILGNDQDIRVIVVEQASEIGPELGPGPRPVILTALQTSGVEMTLGAGLAGIDAEGVMLSTGERIPSLTVLWTAGVEASPLAAQVPGEKDRLGRVIVDAFLRAPEVDDVIVTGDAASASTDDAGHDTLMSCQHAIPMGKFAGYNAAAGLLRLELKRYKQEYYGTCLDLGQWGAVVSEGWDRKVMYSGAETKKIKQWVNGTVIYPPVDAEEALNKADPELETVTLA
ncbi:NAD(P)/FAD-dependent oxidoreductase [Aspergillus stella-maris]|uniref:NAD(P)/FAD-dependent oxidoreductase n=1 Tax=Aspergillus stella-maris TaxID=1810926 RepID=UPI003CCE2981